MKKVKVDVLRTPMPLLTCPGLTRWLPHFGNPYFVFVDESFRGFFEFEDRGYFVHATVGIPEAQYEAVKAAVAPVFRDYRRLTSPGVREFKHSEFKRLTYSDRRRLAVRLNRILRTNGAFINVFYSPLRSFVLEHVRTSLFAKDQTQVPPDFKTLYDTAVKELISEAKGPGESGLLRKLLLLPVGGVAHMLASFESMFTIVYDPRNSREDRAVISAIDDVLKAVMNAQGQDVSFRWDLRNFVKGFVHDRKSEDELGLQLADLIAGEGRAFFEANAELMDFAASPKLITQTSIEPVITVDRVQGRYFKSGALTRLPSTLKKRWFSPDPAGRTVLQVFREIFGAGIATCYSSWGQPRHIAVFASYVFDQVE